MPTFIFHIVVAAAVAINVLIATGDVNWGSAAFCACVLITSDRTD